MVFTFFRHEKRGWWLHSDYNPDFVVDLKHEIPAYERKWHPDRKLWEIDPLAFDQAKRVCYRYGNVVVRADEPDDPERTRQEQDRRQRADDERRKRDQESRRRAEEQERQRRERENNRRAWDGWGSSTQFSHGCGKDHYAVLHLTEDAPAEVISAAWRALCLLHHPDKGGSVTRMQEINIAYDRIKKERGQK